MRGAAGVTRLLSPIRGVPDRHIVGFCPGSEPSTFTRSRWQDVRIPVTGSLTAGQSNKTAKLPVAWHDPGHTVRVAREPRPTKSVSWVVSRCGLIEHPDDLQP